MAKYRALTIEELNEMEKEFVDFLVLNGIPGDDWVKIKVRDPEKAEGICEAFSDVVFTKILKNCRYIERHAAKQLVSIYCDDQQMHLLGVDAPDDVDIDFTNERDFARLQTDPPAGLQMVKSQKPYKEDRELEIWQMLSDGFFISDAKLYMTLFSAQES